MAAPTPRLRRPTLSILHPQSWWDSLFIWMAAWIERLSTRRLLWLLSVVPITLFRVLVWGVSPAAEPNFEHKPDWRRILIVAIGAAIAALAFSFGLNYLFASAANTLSGSDTGRLYYLHDIHNIRIYTLIAPIYIACASVVIYVYVTSSLFMRRFDEDLSLWESTVLTLRFVVFILVVLGVDAFIQYRYFSEIVTNYRELTYRTPERAEQCRKLLYWFVERSASGELMLNVSGMFYFIGNFVRFGIVVAAVFCFVGASASIVRLGVDISPAGMNDITAVRERLFSFSIIELWTKGLYFILNIHGKVWGDSCLSGHLNIRLAGAAVFAVGWVALTIPRNFVEYRLWRVLRQQAIANPQEGMPDLRNQETVWLYSLASSLFFLAVAMLVLVSIDGPVGPQTLLGILGYLGLGWLLSLLGFRPY
jgi:hypothetical protein